MAAVKVPARPNIVAAQREEQDAVVRVLESELKDTLTMMPTDQLWETAKRRHIQVETPGGEPRRRMDLIEDILTAEIEQARRDMLASKRVVRVEQKAPTAPTDPDIRNGTIRLTPEEMALVMAAMLPANASVHPLMSRAEMFERTAQKVGPDTVAFSRRDSLGNERLYRIKLEMRWTVTLEGDR